MKVQIRLWTLFICVLDTERLYPPLSHESDIVWYHASGMRPMSSALSLRFNLTFCHCHNPVCDVITLTPGPSIEVFQCVGWESPYQLCLLWSHLKVRHLFYLLEVRVKLEVYSEGQWRWPAQGDSKNVFHDCEVIVCPHRRRVNTSPFSCWTWKPVKT